MSKWTFVLTDLLGAQLGELTGADSRIVTFPLNRMPTASFVIPTDHRLANYLIDADWEGLLKCYRNGVLRFIGPIVGSDDQWDSSVGVQRLAVNAASPMWRLGFRLLGVTPYGWGQGTAAAPVDLGLIAHDMLDDANLGNAGFVSSVADTFTGISKGTRPGSGMASGAAGTYYFKPVADAIAELSAAVNGFDYEVAMQEPVGGSVLWPEIGKLNIYNVLGTTKPGIHFEFGTTKANLTGYGRTLDRSAKATLGYIQQPAASDHSGTLFAKDDATETTDGRFEAVVDDGGTEWNTLRQDIVNQNVAIRKKAREIVSIQPHPNASPSVFDDYIVGDIVPVTLVVNSRTLLNGNVRIWGATFNIDKEDNETQTLQTIPQ